MKGNILLIDDNIMDLKVAALSIERLGFTCHAYTNYKEALKFSAENKINMIFLDLQMPEISGYDLITLLRQQPQSSLVPIIIISGKNQTDDVRKAITLGANDYIVKPLDPLVIQEKLRKSEPNEKDEFFSVDVSSNSKFSAGYFSKSFRVNSISEFGISAVTDSPILLGESVEATSLSPEIFGSDKVYLRCLSSEMIPESGLYLLQMTFVGMNEKQRQLIRKNCRQLWMNSKQERKQVA
ncbi:MAG: response regulator [Bdellovibrio sp.]|jgi:CheY-like chemotaxis protein